MDMGNGKLEELSFDMIIGRDLLFSLGMIIFFSSPVHVEIKKGAIPKHYEPFPVLKIHEMALKN